MFESFKIQGKRDTIKKSINVPTDQISQLKQLADRYGITLNDIVVQCIDYALKHLDTDTCK